MRPTVTPVQEFARGFGHTLRGLRYMLRNPAHALLGLVPPLVVGFLALVVLVVIAIFSVSIATALTPFADNWPDAQWRENFRYLVALALVVGSGVGLLLTFATLTLTLGSPVYDKISAHVDSTLPPARVEATKERSNVVGDVASMLGRGALVGIAAFLIGLIPGVGAVVAFVFGALVGGWLLSLELLESPMSRRNVVRLRSRRALARSRRPLCVGFAAPVYIAMMLPIVSIIVFPVAAAGAVYLTRDLRGESFERDPR